MELAALLKSSWKVLLSVMAWLLRRMVGWVLRPVFLQSHRHHLGLRKWQQRWHNLDENLDYQLALASTMTDDPNPTSYVHIRNVGQTSISYVNVSVVARKGKVQFSETLSIPLLDAGAIDTQKLLKIPVQDMWCDDEGIRVSYESVHLVLNSYECGGELRQPRKKTLEASIMFCDFLTEGAWMRFENKLYNVKTISDYITHHQHKIYFHLGSKRGLIPLSRQGQWDYIRRSGHYGLLPWCMAYVVLSYRPFVAAYCWAKLLLLRPAMRFDPEQSYWWA